MRVDAGVVPLERQHEGLGRGVPRGRPLGGGTACLNSGVLPKKCSAVLVRGLFAGPMRFETLLNFACPADKHHSIHGGRGKHGLWGMGSTLVLQNKRR